MAFAGGPFWVLAKGKRVSKRIDERNAHVPSQLQATSLNGVLGLGTGTATVCAVGVTGEFDHVGFLQTEDILEPPTDRLQDILALRRRASGLITGNALAHGASPQTNTVKALAHIHNNSHDLVVAIALEGLADGCQLGVQPQVVDGNRSLVLKLI